MRGEILPGSGVQLLDLVQMLCSNGITTCLTLFSPGAGFELKVNILEGRIINISSCHPDDREAMIHAMLQDHWNFEMNRELDSHDVRIQESPIHFLLHCAVEADTRRDAFSAAATQPIPSIDILPLPAELAGLSQAMQEISDATGLGTPKFFLFEQDERLCCAFPHQDNLGYRVEHRRAADDLHRMIRQLSSRT